VEDLGADTSVPVAALILVALPDFMPADLAEFAIPLAHGQRTVALFM
jgi:hypothetical protein